MTFTTTAPDDDARREKARQHFAWQDQVAERSDLSPVVRLCAWALARRRNILSGHCSLSYAGLAKRMGGLSERSAIRAVRTLERAGLIVVDRRVGRGRTNQFTFVMPEKVTQPCQGFAAEKGDKPGARRPPEAARKGDKPDPEKVTELCHPNKERASTKPSQQRERECAQARETARTGARPSDGPAPVRKAELATDRPGGKVKGGARERTGRKSEAFLELRQLWRRPWADDDDAEAMAAFTAATRSGVRAETILDAAKAWVEGVDGPRYLPGLSQWLAKRGWEKSPPGRDRSQRNRARDAAPGPDRPRPQRTASRKPDLFAIAMRVGGYTETADGRFVLGDAR
jgi:helix-turn-helix protein